MTLFNINAYQRYILASLVLLSVLVLFTNTVSAQPSPATCFAAVNSTQQYVESHKKIAEAKFNSGTIIRSEYTKAINDLHIIQDSITVEHCMAGTNEPALFDCLAANDGNYSLCQKNIAN